MKKIDTDSIKPLPYPTETYKIRNAYKMGQEHARNHFHGEEPDPDWLSGTTWAHNPYSPDRPSIHHSFIAGFSEEWAALIAGQ